MPRVKVLYQVMLALYVLALLWLTLFKFSLDMTSVLDHQSRTLDLIPFADISKDNLREMISNFVVFIPFGLLMAMNLERTGLWQKVALVLGFSLTVETIQFVFAIGITDITDVITNTLGGFLGLAVYDISHKYVTKKKLDRFIAITGATLLIGLFGILSSGIVRLPSTDRPDGDMQLDRRSARP